MAASPCRDHNCPGGSRDTWKVSLTSQNQVPPIPSKSSTFSSTTQTTANDIPCKTCLASQTVISPEVHDQGNQADISEPEIHSKTVEFEKTEQSLPVKTITFDEGVQVETEPDVKTITFDEGIQVETEPDVKTITFDEGIQVETESDVIYIEKEVHAAPVPIQRDLVECSSQTDEPQMESKSSETFPDPIKPTEPYGVAPSAADHVPVLEPKVMKDAVVVGSCSKHIAL